MVTCKLGTQGSLELHSAICAGQGVLVAASDMLHGLLPVIACWQRPTEMVGWCCGTQSSARKRHGKPVGASPLKRSLFMELIPDRTSVVSLGVETVHGCSPRPRGRISSFGARLRRFLLRPRHWEPEVSLGVLRKVSH